MASVHRVNSSSSDLNFKLSCDSVLRQLIPPDESLLQTILSSNNSEIPEIHLSDDRKFVWYFAIGSMINPISLYLRDLIPLMSYPATCLDHRVVFRGAVGMADIEERSGSTFDGVVHLLTDEQMHRLDEIEAFYHRVPINCRNYQNQLQKAYAYQMNLNNQPIGIPQERYLDIIIKGCEYYKVRPEYIQDLRNDQPVVPRKKPEDFQSFTDIPENAFFTHEELQRHNGNNATLPMWVSLNGKILEYAGVPPTDHPDYEFQQRFYHLIRQKFSGREISGLMAKTLYEPLYKLPLTDEDISDEHRAHIEDHYFEMLASPQNKTYWKVIGRVRSHH